MYKTLATLVMIVGLGWICGPVQADPERDPLKFNWKGGDGDWEDPAKWNVEGEVPPGEHPFPGENPKDEVRISPGDPSYTIKITAPAPKRLDRLHVFDAAEGKGVIIKADSGMGVFDVSFLVAKHALYIGKHNAVLGADGNRAAGHPAGGCVELEGNGAAGAWNLGTLRGGNGADGIAGAVAGAPGGSAVLRSSKFDADNEGLIRGGNGGNGFAAGRGGDGGAATLEGVDAWNTGKMQGGNGGHAAAGGGADGGDGGHATISAKTGLAINQKADGEEGLVEGGRGGDGDGNGDGGVGGNACVIGPATRNLDGAILQGGRGGNGGGGAAAVGGRGGFAGMDAGDGGWKNTGIELGGNGGDAVAGTGGSGGDCCNTRGRIAERVGNKTAGNKGNGARNPDAHPGNVSARAAEAVLLTGPGAGGEQDDYLSGDLVVVRCDPAGEMILDGLSPYAIQADTEVYLIAGYDGVIVLQNMEPGVVVIDAPVVYACGLVLSPDELTLEDLCPPDTEIYYERGACTPPPNPHLGDMNCDAVVNFRDINPFVLAVTDMMAYMEAFPGCDWLNGDINDDGWTDFGDINPFVTLLLGQ